ncbi:MAG: FG-GAP-like repeat-containing protein [Lysobacterales bacterium]
MRMDASTGNRLRSGLCSIICWLGLGASVAVATPTETELGAAIAAREYHASLQPSGWQAPNRAQDFRIHFESDGVELTAREHADQPLLSMQLTHWGRANRLQPPGEGTLAAQAERVERRSAGLTEWYVNTPAGLEHGFDLSMPPPGQGALEFHLRSDQPVRLLHVDALEFGRGEQRWRYQGLKAWDASGRVLPSRMQVVGAQRWVLRVDDSGARYPIVVDPLLTRSADISRNGSQSGAEFGIRIANAGDVNNDGADDLVVGAFKYDDGATDNGAAFVFLGPGFSVANSTFLSVGQAGAAFGAGVGGAGDLNNDGYDDVVVGAPNYDLNAGNPNTGAFYVYFGGPGAFDPIADASVIGPTQNDNMGAAVSGVGDVNNDGIEDLAVGVPRFNPGGQVDSGRVFVYYGGSSFDTVADASLGLAQAVSAIGSAVAGRGDVNGDGIDDLVIGAGGYEAPGGALLNEGAALVFFGGNGSLDQSVDAILRSNSNGATGGASVALGDLNGDGIDDVISGAPLHAPTANVGGMVQIWYGASGAFNTTVDVTLASTQAAEQFGRSVGVLPDINADGRKELIVGAPGAVNSAALVAGKVRLYFPSAAGIAAPASLELEGNQADALFGTSVAAGDYNGDGAADVAVGEPGRDTGASVNHGAIYAYLGQTDELFRNGYE